MGIFLKLAELKSGLDELHVCKTYIMNNTSDPSSQNIVDEIMSKRARDEKARKCKRYIEAQLSMADFCSTDDAITHEPIEVLDRMKVGRHCYSASTLAEYLTVDMNDQNDRYRSFIITFGFLGPDALEMFDDDWPARNPMTNLQLNQDEMESINEQLDHLLVVHEVYIKQKFNVEPRTLYEQLL